MSYFLFKPSTIRKMNKHLSQIHVNTDGLIENSWLLGECFTARVKFRKGNFLKPVSSDSD